MSQDGGKGYNQGKLNALSSSISQRLAETARCIENYSARFINYLAANWECNQAVDFAAAYKTSMEDVIKQFNKNIAASSGVLAANVKNYAIVVGNTVTWTELVGVTVTFNTENIKNQFSNGDVGIKDALDASTATDELNTMCSKIEDFMQTTRTSITSSAAFMDSEELSEISSLFGRLLTILKTAINTLKAQLNTAIDSTISAYGTVKSTNVSNSSSAQGN